MGLLLAAGVAQAQVVDGEFDIVDRNESEAFGSVDVEDEDFEAVAVVVCTPPSTTDGGDGSLVRFLSHHPDKVSLTRSNGRVSQKKRGNQAVLIVRTGGGSGTINAALSCEKATVDSSVNTKNSPAQGKFKGTAKNCTCEVGVAPPGSPFGPNSQGVCDGHEARLAQVEADCANLKSIKGSFDTATGEIKKIRVQGWGDATPD
jgi:hypothetical protein